PTARDTRPGARYGGPTGSPDESGSRSREKGLSRSGNARVRRGVIQLAWRFLRVQNESALGQGFEMRTKNARTSRKKMIVALARKLLIALWHLVRDGVVPEGVVLRPAHRREGRGHRTPDGFGPCLHARDGVADDGSRWRGPGPHHGFKCRL